MAFNDLRSQNARRAYITLMVTSNHQWLLRAALRVIDMPKANWKSESDFTWIRDLLAGMQKRLLIRKANNETTELSTLMSPKQWDVLRDRVLKYTSYLEVLAD